MEEGRGAPDFMAALKASLEEPSIGLNFKVADLLDLLDKDFLKKLLPKRPSVMWQIPTILGSVGGGGRGHWLDIFPSETFSMASKVFEHSRDVYAFEKHKATLERMLRGIVLSRPTISLSEREKGITLAMGVLHTQGIIDNKQWGLFLGQLVWHGGATELNAPKEYGEVNELLDAQKLLNGIMQGLFPPYPEFIAQSVQTVATFRDIGGPEGELIMEALSSGARWLTKEDLRNGQVFDAQPKEGSLIIGHLPGSQTPVGYSGDASLITIAAPNTGKTQGQVIPNLLSYPGSVFVLDVKGELWETTAGYRAERFGPVYRFSPNDDDGRSHCYNPFDVIPNDPLKAGPACQVLANQLIPEPLYSTDRYWEDKARSFLWGFAMLVALDEEPEQRNLMKMVEYLNVPLDFEGREHAIEASQAMRLAFKLKRASVRLNIPELDTLATAIEDGLIGQRLSSVFDVARSRLSGLVRNTVAAKALSVSHWTPRDLSERPGMSLYLSFKPGEISAFSGIIRLIFQQHVDVLTREFRYGAVKHPITFFLDELPQLGHMASLNAILDVGRGAGLRLWMFAQFLGQLREIYGQRADGIVGATQIRCFQQPDNDAAQMLFGMLGSTRSLLNGEEKPLAYPHELAGRQHGDKVVVVARGEHPSLLETRKAFSYFGREMSVRPPIVPRVDVT